MSHTAGHPPLPPGTSVAEILNRSCRCLAVDDDRLQALLTTDPHVGPAIATLLPQRPHLFALPPVFLAREHLEQMAAVISAVETLVALPAYREAVLAWAPPIAHVDHGPAGAFLGYDFHLDAEGPKLIEINTNAGGALLNAVLARAAYVCCDEVMRLSLATTGAPDPAEAFLDMFLNEWRLQRGATTMPATLAIVDDVPAEQYLYPEFLLFQALFRRAGLRAFVADARTLEYRDGALFHDGQRIDLVYNRLTDFALAEPGHAALRAAYLEGAAVVTPHPRAHALYADKRNLTLLGAPDRLRALGAPETVVATLAHHVPPARLVTHADAEKLWTDRKALFFKPASGFGSRGAYRGDKLTRRVFEAILEGGYVAQAYVPPSERTLADPAASFALKTDFRAYVYGGRIQLVAARLYQGQTTNFRTPGGGFAPVFSPALVAAERQPSARNQQ